MIKLENVSYTYMKGGPGEFIGVIGHTGSASQL